MPLSLQRLDVLRLKGSGGQTQTHLTQTAIEMFRQANMFEITPEDLMKIVLLHTIQDKSIMIKVLENMGPRDRWQEVRDSIIRIDRVNTMGGAYLSTQTKQTGASVQPGKGKTCDTCGRKGHLKITCRIPKEKLKCTHCKNEGSHAMVACK